MSKEKMIKKIWILFISITAGALLLIACGVVLDDFAPGVDSYEANKDKSNKDKANQNEETVDPVSQTASYQTDTIERAPSGHLRGGVLDSDVLVDGVIYKGGAWLRYDDKGAVFIGTLRDEATIDGLTYRDWISYFPSGRVSIGTLSKDANIGGTSYPTGTYLEYNPDGSVASARRPH